MSLLSTPTGRPERVFSLISLVHALGGRIKSGDAKEWLVPQYRSGEPPLMDNDHNTKAGERVREVFRVARDLKLLDADKDDWVSTGEIPGTRRAFARHVHAHLCGLPKEDPDAVLLRAYAWCTTHTEAYGTAALVRMTANDLAREIAAGLGRKNEGDDEKSFNTTKLTAWKDWMVFLGLGWNDLPGLPGFMPDPSRRIEEELQILIPSTTRIDARSFLAAVAKTLPYLDGGPLFEEACNKGFPRPPIGQLSRMLSQAIRALEEIGVIRCEMEGDTKNGVGLFPNQLSNINAFSHVVRLLSNCHV